MSIHGQLAAQFGYRLSLQVLQSANGYYLGTEDDGGPVSRESVEYFPDRTAAEQALSTGEWTQRDHA